MRYYDDFKDPRFQSAASIGRHADMIFRMECLKRGLDPDQAILAPLDAMIGSPSPELIRMTTDDILNLWYDGLTRPEIMALGASFGEFQWAMQKARAVGDQRAYYRHGNKSRLPWQIGITETAKRRMKKHRTVANGVAAGAGFTPETGKDKAMKKGDRMGSGVPPRPSSVGPSFVGKRVDDLVDVFAQIDEAKRELDKRFVPNSDILMTEVNKD